MDELLADIAAFNAKHELTEWQFGELALNDRHFVRQLRAGRDIRLSTLDRVRAFIEADAPRASA